MTQPMVKVAKLNNNRYEISVESEHDFCSHWRRAHRAGRLAVAPRDRGQNLLGREQTTRLGKAVSAITRKGKKVAPPCSFVLR